MDFLRQFCILSKKNLKLRKAHYILTIVEFVLPILVSISMIFISSLDPNKGSYYSPAYHAPEPMAKYKVFDNNLFYYPPNSFTETLTKMILSKGSPKLNITAFKSEELLIRAIKNNSVSTIGLIFHDANEHKLSYSICKNTYSGSLLLFTEYPDYYVKESIQVVLNNVYMKYMTSHSNLTDEGNKIKMFLEYFPRIGYSLKAFNGIAPFTNSIIIVSTLTIFVSVYVYRIVQEKRSGLRELLRLNGMKISVNYLSWCFHGFIALFILSLSWIAFMSISTDQSAFLEGTNKFIVWIVLLLYSISLLLFSTFISVFFSNGIYAVIFTILIMQGTLYGPIFSTGLLNDMNEFRFMSVDFRLSLCLLPNSALFLVLKLILALKMNDSDLTWNTMNDSANTYDNFTMSSIILMQFVACIFYSILIWYFDAVWPWQIGVSKPPYFFLLKSYWTNKMERNLPQELLMDSDENSQFHESIPSSQRVGIWVKNLTKKFGNKAAASDVNLKIFEGQITALLGHNGAGKTTTLSVIAGMYKPTHGSVYIDGINLVNDIDLIRKKMGYCPQTNIHFNELTVYDHLELTATLKAYPKHKIESEIEKIAATVGLFEKLNTPVSALSGGMKRKLSLGIALVGQTKVLLLDEPTSGLDPEARRELWDILQSIRHNKTILLTTHYMEEADILGDRIAIMTHGKVFCSGSPLYLKSKFGAGYHLRMILKDGFNVENILNFINQKVSAKFERLSGKELSLLISSCDYTELPNMLKEFENSTEDLFVENFGLSHTNMEDVFIKVGEMTSENGSKDNVNNSNNDLSSLNNTNNYEDALKETNKLTGYRLIINQIFALLCKRFHFNRRQIWGMIMQIALPLIFSFLMLYTPKWLSEARRARDANIDLHLNSLYKQTKTLVTVESDQIYSDYKNVFKGEKTEFIRTNNLKNEILKIQKESFAKFIYRYVIGSEINKTTNGYHITAFASSFAAYGMPISINKMYNLKFNLLNLPSRIESSFKPLMEEHNISVYDKFTRIAVFDPIMIAIFLPLALGFISSTATLFLIEEKNSKSKHLQLMTNLHPALFWFCHFLWDIIICLIISFACGLIVIYSSVIKDDSSASGAVILLFLFYNLSYIPFIYIISLWLKKPAYGFAIILGLTTAIGTAGQVLAMINFFSKKRLSIHLDSMVKFIKIFPPASLSISISELNYQLKLKPLCPFIQYLDCTTLRKKSQEYACCIIPKDYNPFGTKYGESGASLLYMMGFGMVFWAIFIILESKLFQKFLVLLKNNFKKRKEDNHSLASIDADVIAEEDLVTDVMQRHNSSLAIYKLRKEFKEIVAVDSFSILVPEKKCFGLLGVNGAGKTTTFSMIVADQFKTSGDARIHNYHLSSTISNFQKMIGYCPQSNALLHLLSGSEMIYLFARLRGIPEAKIKRMVDVLVKLVDLEEHINKQCEIYSGGNKRKLNIALAVIGLPPLLLLDEPTSGIDPVSRRQIWKLLTNVKEMGLSLLLSSHSMEECEALCDKLTIMTKGSLKCIGSITHLKNKFRNGFTILAKLKLENEDNNDAKINNLTARIQRDINNISLKKQNIGLLTYHIENPQESWSHMFQVMEKIKEEMNLEDYVITSTTLEEVFMSFVSSDNDDS